MLPAAAAAAAREAAAAAAAFPRLLISLETEDLDIRQVLVELEEAESLREEDNCES